MAVASRNNPTELTLSAADEHDLELDGFLVCADVRSSGTFGPAHPIAPGTRRKELQNAATAAGRRSEPRSAINTKEIDMPDRATDTTHRIVVGTFAGILLGAVSQHCVRHAPRPVVVVPDVAE